MCLRMQGIKAENTPHYKVLFSGPGPSSLVIGYLPQTQLERITGMRVCLKNKNLCTHKQKYVQLKTSHTPLSDASSRIFPCWRITSHISTGSVSSCSPGSEKSSLRTPVRTPAKTPGWILTSRGILVLAHQSCGDGF